MTEENKKKEAQGVEKRAISKITNVGEAPLSGCRIQEKIDWKGVTFALVLLATIDVSLKRLSGKKKEIYYPVTCSVTRIEKLLKFLEKYFPKAQIQISGKSVSRILWIEPFCVYKVRKI